MVAEKNILEEEEECEVKMEIEFLKKEDNETTFIVRGINSVFANTLRRLIIDEVPTLAIEDVEIHKNSSAMYDEMLAHRLGLIPLTTDLKSYTMPDECRCKGKGCAHCQLHMQLKAKGPCVVYSSEITSKDSKVKPAFPKIPIVKLLKDQEIELDAVAVLGTGKDHVKFSPGLIYYHAYPNIKLTDAKKAAAEVCPTGAVYLKDDKLKSDEQKCILCKACEEKGSEIKSSETDFVFTLESFGQLSPKEIINTAIKVFQEKLKKFDKLVDKI